MRRAARAGAAAVIGATAALWLLAGCGGRPQSAAPSFPWMTEHQPVAQQAREHFEKGDYEVALRLYRRAAGMNPNDWSAVHQIGMCYYRMGQYPQAITNFQVALEIREMAPTRSGLGFSYLHQQNYQEAARQLRRAIELGSSDPDDYGGLADACLELGWYEEALKAAETGLAKAGNPEGPNRFRGLMLEASLALGRYREAAALSGGQPQISVVMEQTPEGVKIRRASKGGPADLAGLRAGDLIVAAGGQRVAQMPELVKIVRASAVGSRLGVTVSRGGQQLELPVVVGITPDLPALAATPAPASAPAAAAAASAPQRASMRVARLEVKPATVPPGAPFDLELEYVASDPEAGAGAVPVQFSFTILAAGQTVHSQPAVVLEAPNGQRRVRVEHLTAAPQAGSYRITVSLRARSAAAEESIDFRIQ